MINVTVGEQKPQESKPFPKLMKSKESGNILLFLNERCATCIVLGEGNQGWNVGEHNTLMISGIFEDFNEPITIQNA